MFTPDKFLLFFFFCHIRLAVNFDKFVSLFALEFIWFRRDGHSFPLLLLTLLCHFIIVEFKMKKLVETYLTQNIYLNKSCFELLAGLKEVVGLECSVCLESA